MKRASLALIGMSCMLVAIAVSYSIGQTAQSPTLPFVSVGNVTATTPVLRSTPAIDVSAMVTATFDTNSGLTTTTVNNSCTSTNNYCNTGDSAVTDQTLVRATTISVADRSVSVSAADPYSSASLRGSGTSYSGTLPTPTAGTDGATKVTVWAQASEDVTTTVAVVTTNLACSSHGVSTTCTTVSASTSGTSTTKATKKSNVSSGTATYVLDINPPIITLKPIGSQPSVLQGEDKNIHTVMVGGSANTPYRLTDTAYDPSGNSSASGSGTFGPGGDGIAPNEHGLVGVHIACDAPIGQYTAKAVADTVDLGFKPFPQVSSRDYTDNKGNDSGQGTDTFMVLPGTYLEDQTQVVSELPPSGDYASMSCFTATQGGNEISTAPATLHITATVNTIGPCVGFNTLSGTVITLTLPNGFSFADSGASPTARVFVGPAAGGFDFHYPQTLAEVTSLISTPTVSGQTVTVDLGSLNLGLPDAAAGVIPSGYTIYVRAHAVFSGGLVPDNGTQYVFTTSTTANLSGIGLAKSSSFQRITASSACVNGY